MSESNHNPGSEEYLTVEELARRLGYEPKTVRNKMAPNGIFKKGIHYAESPGLPVLFRWSAVVALYRWDGANPPPPEEAKILMARGYEMR